MSVVIPTHNRPGGLARLLTALEAQSLSAERFEAIVVDDGSSIAGQSVAGEAKWVRTLRHERPRGPAAARNTGWRAARAPLIAFVDDDCEPAPGWLEALVGTAESGAVDVIQGRVCPPPEQVRELTPLSHTIEVPGFSRLFVSCNIAYARALLERVGGFDETFERACGEDVELGARVEKAGARTAFDEAALVYHEVRQLTLREHLRHTAKWTDGVRAVSMHPELRDLLVSRLFWKPTHPRLMLLAAGLASRSPLLLGALSAPYVDHYRGLYPRSPRALARALPKHVVIDLWEVATAIRGSVRHRTLML